MAKGGQNMKVTMVNSTENNPRIKCTLRFDVVASTHTPKLFFGSNDSTALAKQNRLKEVNLIKNLPMQGITYERIYADGEIYTLEEENDKLAYAPIEVTLYADVLEDLLPLIFRDSFRRIEILEPKELSLDKFQGERLLVRIVKEFNQKLQQLYK